MHQLSNQQLTTIITELDKAISYHNTWYKRLLRIFVANLTPTDTDLIPNGHMYCPFGKWYEGHGSDLLKKDTTFITLKNTHYYVHQHATDLLHQVASKQSIQLEAWDQFDHQIEKMNAHLTVLRENVVEIAQNRDPLTGAKTRAMMLPQIQEHYESFAQEGINSALVMLDLDHFKKVNDEYGHSSGDEVLIAIVQCIKKHLRPTDSIYRYGGEEFLLLIPEIELKPAEKIIERLRIEIENLSIPLTRHQTSIKVTASFGLTQFSSSRPIGETIDFADEAVYMAKNAGRNCVITHC